MNYKCHRCQADLIVGSMGCAKCGMRFAAPVPPLAEPTAAPGVAAAPVTPAPASAGGETSRLEQMAQALQRKIKADRVKPTRVSRLDEFLAARKGLPVPPPQEAAPAPVTPSWVQPQPPRSVASNVQRVPQPPMPPMEVKLPVPSQPIEAPLQKRRKKRVIAAAVVLVVAGLLFTGLYNIWDTVFPPHSMPGYNAPTVAQAQAAFATDIPVTPAAPAAAPVQQAAAPPPPVVLAPPQQTYAPQDAEVPGGQTPDASSANSAAPQSGFVPTEQSPERHYQSEQQETACNAAPQARYDAEQITSRLVYERNHLDMEEDDVKSDQDEIRDHGSDMPPEQLEAEENDVANAEDRCKSVQATIDSDLQSLEADRLTIAQCGGQ